MDGGHRVGLDLHVGAHGCSLLCNLRRAVRHQAFWSSPIGASPRCITLSPACQQ